MLLYFVRIFCGSDWLIPIQSPFSFPTEVHLLLEIIKESKIGTVWLHINIICNSINFAVNYIYHFLLLSHITYQSYLDHFQIQLSPHHRLGLG